MLFTSYFSCVPIGPSFASLSAALGWAPGRRRSALGGFVTETPGSTRAATGSGRVKAEKYASLLLFAIATPSDTSSGERRADSGTIARVWTRAGHDGCVGAWGS